MQKLISVDLKLRQEANQRILAEAIHAIERGEGQQHALIADEKDVGR